MNTLLRGFILALVASAMGGPGCCYGFTTTYTFDTPPDNVHVLGSSQWPQQILDNRMVVEQNARIEINNQVNNSLFVGDNDFFFENATALSGTYAWFGAFGRGPMDPAFFEIDFTNWIGGVPQKIEYDLAVAAALTQLGAIVFDTQGNSENIETATTPYSFMEGENNGATAHVTLTPIGSLQNLAKLRFSFGEGDGSTILRAGLDNLVVDNGASADLDGNGVVDGEDLADWQSAYGSNTNGGDTDGDGDTDSNDFLFWQRELTNPTSFALVPTTLPEPTACVFCGAALVILPGFSRIARRRSR